MKRLIIRLNKNDKLEALLQETYDLSNKQIIEIQDEINKLINSTKLNEITIDEKAKYGKVLHDFIGDKDKVIVRKFEIAKLLGEIIKHGGSVNKTLEDNDVAKASKLDLKSLREQLKEDDSPNKYELNNR